MCPWIKKCVNYNKLIILLGKKCITYDSAYQNTGKPCVFPFIVNGVTYTECTTAYGASQPWCSTLTDENGNIIDGQWGYCAPDCAYGKYIVILVHIHENKSKFGHEIEF